MARCLSLTSLNFSSSFSRVYLSSSSTNLTLQLTNHVLPFSLLLSRNRSVSISCCSESQNGAQIHMSRYKEAFARRMAMAGLKPHHRIAIGVSGGPDSMALCVLASSWKTSGANNVAEHKNGFIGGLLAIIVDHGLRSESKEEAYSVSRRVLDMGISCEIAHCEWLEGKPKKGHLQEEARDRRYQIFHNICVQHQISVLLVAHHADDQAELFIIRLSRNSGVLGLAGMAFTSQLYSRDTYFNGEDTSNHGILLVRPLLEFSKDDMYQICQCANQEWVEDPTNRSPTYARNRIRLAVKEISSSIFDSEVKAVIFACRRTRTYVDQICSDLIDHAVSIMPEGYAVINLSLLNPSEVEDLCLSKFIALVLQFISQRHRPVRGSAMKQLLNYFRNIPCKESFTAAGCYLCPAPGSKGTKILVSCSINSTSPSENEVLQKLSYRQKHLSTCDISQIIADGKSNLAHIPDASSAYFLNIKSSESLLVEAKKLNLLGDFTFKSIISMQKDETKLFRSLSDEGSEENIKSEVKHIGSSSSEILQKREIGYFMDRFLVKWDKINKIDSNTIGENQISHCNFCLLDQIDVAKVRHMVDADWLYLAKLSHGANLENSEALREISSEIKQQVIYKTNLCIEYAKVSAQKALVLLKSIPVAARRGLPVLDNPQGQLISIPSVGFKHCPCLTVSADFRPRVPLGGGHSSF